MEKEVNSDNFQINFSLTAAQVNVILAALGTQPHDVVRHTIDNILSQDKPQYEDQYANAIKSLEIS